MDAGSATALASGAPCRSTTSTLRIKGENHDPDRDLCSRWRRCRPFDLEINLATSAGEPSLRRPSLFGRAGCRRQEEHLHVEISGVPDPLHVCERLRELPCSYLR